MCMLLESTGKKQPPRTGVHEVKLLLTLPAECVKCTWTHPQPEHLCPAWAGREFFVWSARPEAHRGHGPAEKGTRCDRSEGGGIVTLHWTNTAWSWVGIFGITPLQLFTPIGEKANSIFQQNLRKPSAASGERKVLGQGLVLFKITLGSFLVGFSPGDPQLDLSMLCQTQKS